MIITPVKIRILCPPKDDFLKALEEAIERLDNKSILAVTSKVVSIWQGRCVPKYRVTHKDELIMREADKYLPRDLVPNRWVMHTIKNNLFIPSAGIDESNADGHYILWPKNPKQAAEEICKWGRRRFGISDFGVIITDSHTIPLRRGTTGISLAHCGFAPLRDYRGKPDLFGRPFAVSQLNIVDGLAAATVLVMGEGREQTPCALISDLDSTAVFGIFREDKEKPYSSLAIEEKEDLYYPFISSAPWRKGGCGR